MQVLRLERDKCHHPSFCRDNCYIGSNIVLHFCGESGTTVLTGLMLTLRIYEGVSFITAIFQLAQAKQPVTKGGSRVHLCLKEMKELIDPFCTALCFWGQFKISAVSRGQKVIFAVQGRPFASLALIHIYYLFIQCYFYTHRFPISARK